jgi:hypothetical protein
MATVRAAAQVSAMRNASIWHQGHLHFVAIKLIVNAARSLLRITGWLYRNRLMTFAGVERAVLRQPTAPTIGLAVRKCQFIAGHL